MMSSLTGALYGALVVYLGGWFVGAWTGNFSLLLFILTSVTLAYWLAERFHFRPARLAAAAHLEQQDAGRRAELARLGIEKVDGDVQEAKQKLLMQPWWLDWTAGLFPVILIVFLLPFAGLFAYGLTGTIAGVIVSVFGYYLTPYLAWHLGFRADR